MRLVLIFMISFLVAGCKIEVHVPSGGSVVSDSGTYSCFEGQICLIEVKDTNFDETFEAAPKSGYTFVGWKKQDRGLCGGNKRPCELSTASFEGNDKLTSFLSTDESFYLEPIFKKQSTPTNQLRRYQGGDWIEFSGSGVVEPLFGSPTSASINMRWDFYDEDIILQSGQKALMLGQTIQTSAGEREVLYSVFYQDEQGAWINVISVVDTVLAYADTGLVGIVEIPSPLNPPDYIQFRWLHVDSGDHKTVYAMVDRATSVSAKEIVSVPAGVFSAYRVVQEDTIDYLEYFRGAEQGDRQEIYEINWIDPKKGIVKLYSETEEYNQFGTLRGKITLELELVDSSF